MKAAGLLWCAAASLGNPTDAKAQWNSDQWLESPVSDEVFENYLGFFTYDDGLDFRAEVRGSEQREGIHTEQIRFQSTPGVFVTADYYRPAGAARGSRPHVIVVHGGGPMGKGMMAPFAELLVRQGMNVLAIDLLHFGERTTDLLTTFTANEKADRLYNQKPVYLEWVVQTVKDVGRSFDLLTSRYGADPQRIAYHGFSRGAEVGFIVTGVEKRFGAVSLVYGGHFDRLETGHLAAACPANYVGRIAPTPTLLLNGRFDSDYDRELSVDPLHRLFGEPTEIRWVDTGHQRPTPEDQRGIADWLSRQLAGN